MKKIALLFLVLMLSCNKRSHNSHFKESVKKNDQLLKRENKRTKKVIITGTTDDIIGFQYLNISTENNIEYYNENNFKKEIIGDSLHLILSSINKPVFAEIAASGNNKNFYRGRVFLIPGDTISIRIKYGKLKFKGANAVYNNFYSELAESTPDYNRNPYQGNLMDYKQKVKSIYDQRTAFLHKYVKKHNIESDFFLKTITINLRHEYLYNPLCILNNACFNIINVSIKNKFVNVLNNC